ncbi:MAG: hypothetical protein KGI73_00915 [Patescibacteria group bacterium]|nr:hypothetical protein [Patescibacteria group bacterium]
MKLLFVYNADGSFAASMRDTVKKVVAPKHQECNLCAITYPLFAMDKEWSAFVKTLPHEVVFLHRDEFRAKYPEQKGMSLPAVFAEDESGLRVLIPSEDINHAKSVADLIALVQKSLTHTAP